MSDKANSEELEETTVSSVEIDALKDEEKEKLSAAEAAYKKRQTVSANGSSTQDATSDQHRTPGENEPRSKMPWIPGLILIGLGVIFLLNNFTGFELHNWWALFILIPAFGSFSKAADTIRAEGEITRQAWGAIAGGLILSLVASAFLFDLNWGVIWPVFLIVGGLGLLLGGLGKA